MEEKNDIAPDEQCLLCGEKHFSYAMQLANEIGYIEVNTQRIIGELVASQWHIHEKYPEISESIREIRHLIQERTTSQIDWAFVAKSIHSAVLKDIEENSKIVESTAWAKGLIGDSPKISLNLEKICGLHKQFESMKNSKGGCSSCKLKRLNRQFREILSKL